MSPPHSPVVGSTPNLADPVAGRGEVRRHDVDRVAEPDVARVADAPRERHARPGQLARTSPSALIARRDRQRPGRGHRSRGRGALGVLRRQAAAARGHAATASAPPPRSTSPIEGEVLVAAGVGEGPSTCAVRPGVRKKTSGPPSSWACGWILWSAASAPGVVTPSTIVTSWVGDVAVERVVGRPRAGRPDDRVGAVVGRRRGQVERCAVHVAWSATGDAAERIARVGVGDRPGDRAEFVGQGDGEVTSTGSCVCFGAFVTKTTSAW